MRTLSEQQLKLRLQYKELVLERHLCHVLGLVHWPHAFISVPSLVTKC